MGYFLGIGGEVLAQEEPPQPVIATFKGTRLYNYHTTETPAHKHLEFRVAHRFGDLRQGYGNFFGIDAGATVRLSLGYAFFPRAEVGVERTGAGKWWNSYIKVRLLRQTTPRGMPVSVTWMSFAFITEESNPPRYKSVTDRLEYLHQVLIARKFSKRLSALLGGIVLHQNMALSYSLPNSWFWLMAAVRFKITRRATVFTEGTFPLWRRKLLSELYPAWSVGTEIDTGGHVFQLGITNADGLSENRSLLTQRPLLRLGFNISRLFSLQGGPKYGTMD
ncbi:MAG: DUF5777 family beta-barrel protein [Bacteroidia bacterium]|nr:DUF5777 family beta-barrel protein [Bacteroidia bacterium]MDW8417539.1 DUF5777 family beta-barrel protein [Bacteroidia bacterium]